MLAPEQIAALMPVIAEAVECVKRRTALHREAQGTPLRMDENTESALRSQLRLYCRCSGYLSWCLSPEPMSPSTQRIDGPQPLQRALLSDRRSIEQNFGPHIEQKCATLCASFGRVSSCMARAFRVQAQIELVLPAELEAGLRAGRGCASTAAITLVQPAGSSYPHAARLQASFRPISCTRINSLALHQVSMRQPAINVNC